MNIAATYNQGQTGAKVIDPNPAGQQPLPRPAMAPMETQIPVDYDPSDIPEQHFYLDSVFSKQAKTRRNIEFGMGLSMQGVGLRDQVKLKQTQDDQAEALRIAQETAKLSDEEFENVLGQVGRERSAMPAAPTMPGREPADIGHVLASLAGIFADPRHAAEYAAMPLYQSEKDRQEKWQNLQIMHENAVAGWKARMANLQDLASIAEKRAEIDREAVKDALRAKDARAIALLGAAKSMQDTASDLTVETAASHFTRLRDLYTQAGYPQLAPTKEEEDATVKALKDRRDVEEKLKNRSEVRKLVPTWIRNLDSKLPATRDNAAFMIRSVFETEPEVFGMLGFNPEVLREKLDAIGQMSEKEKADLANTEASTETKKLQNEFLSKTMPDRIKKVAADLKMTETQTAYVQKKLDNYEEYLLAIAGSRELRDAIAAFGADDKNYENKVKEWNEATGKEVGVIRTALAEVEKEARKAKAGLAMIAAASPPADMDENEKMAWRADQASKAAALRAYLKENEASAKQFRDQIAAIRAKNPPPTPPKPFNRPGGLTGNAEDLHKPNSGEKYEEVTINGKKVKVRVSN